MKIYLAAASERAEEMRGVRDELTALGHEVTSRWIDWRGGPAQIGAEQLNHDAANYLTFTQYAHADLTDIDAADALIVFTGGGDGGDGGYHTAFGYALGKGKLTIMAGPREHVLHTLAAEWYPDGARLVMAISGPNPVSGLRNDLPSAPEIQQPGVSPGYEPDCPQCNEDMHRCPGCGTLLAHGIAACSACLADGEDARTVADQVMFPHGYWETGDY